MIPQLRINAAATTIDVLPIELLSHVFHLAVHAESKHRGLDFDASTIHAPLQLALVSKHWRAVALGTPSIWSSILVTIGEVEDPEHFDTRHIEQFLQLSKGYPVDMLLDTRDMNWDFSEPEITSSFEYSSYVHPFTNRHMDVITSLLTPHVTRWRSLLILTDAWAPMYHALAQIGPAICAHGAPLLESLTLMRCNEFTSHTATFQPASLRDPPFLSTWTNLPILPKLASLTLKGVHADWNSLAGALVASNAPLTHLDFSCHSMSVRPSAEIFSRILSHCAPHLQKLVMRNSGPNFDISDVSSLTPVLLPKLTELSLAYRAGRNGLLSLELMELPELQTLTLEDGTHLGDQHAAIDAGPLLVYIATGVRSRGHLQPFSITYSITEGLKYHPGPLVSTCVAPSWYSVQSPFKKLENVNLIRVQAFPMPFRWFYHSLSNLRSLRLEYMDLNSVYALMPSPFHDKKWNTVSIPSSSPCPCPLLEDFSIRIPGHLDYETFRVVTSGMIKLRPTYGKASKLKQFTVRAVDSVDPRLLDTKRTEEIEGVRVSVQRTEIGAFESDEEEEEEDWDSEDDYENGAFELNGAFNDPHFDSAIGSVIHSSHV